MTRAPVTLHRKIAGDIEGRIRSGLWRPGHRIPFEHELVRQYGCSRATVSKAIHALVAAGLIERRKKAGSFVSQPQVHAALLGIPDIRRAVLDRGETYAFQLFSRLKIAESLGEWPDGKAPEGPVLRLEGLHLADGEPLAFEQREISVSSVPEAVDIDFSKVAPASWLLEHIPWTNGRHRISAVNATSQLARHLRIDTRQACLLVERWTWQVDRPITFVQQTFPGHLYDLVGDFAGAAVPAR